MDPDGALRQANPGLVRDCIAGIKAWDFDGMLGEISRLPASQETGFEGRIDEEATKTYRAEKQR
jgi:hypothetical protein